MCVHDRLNPVDEVDEAATEGSPSKSAEEGLRPASTPNGLDSVRRSRLKFARSAKIDLLPFCLANDLRLEPLGSNGGDQLLVGHRVRRINGGHGPPGIEVHLDPLHGLQ